MSRKTRSKRVNGENRISRTSLVAVAAAVLVLGLVAAAFLYESDNAESLQAEAAARQAALASQHSPTLGDPGAKVHIVEFLDPACETCALFYPMVKQWVAEVPGEIRLSIRHVAFHTGADYAVRILEASRKQDKYWQTLEALLASQHQWTQHHTVQPDRIGPAIAGVGLNMEQLMVDMDAMEVLLRIEQDKKDAILLKVSATPEYFVNGRPLPSFGQQQLADLVREELGK
ncbi:MAG: thioredoxin domain-containing protein [Woeseiaceae bacterium]